MASIAKSQRRVTFKGDNMDRLMKPPCSTLEFDKTEPVSDLLLSKETLVILEPASDLLAVPSFSGLRRSKQAWVPRHLRQKMAEAAAAEKKKTKPKKKFAARKAVKRVDDTALLRRKHENARLRRRRQEGFDIIQAIKERRGIPKDQQCLCFTYTSHNSSPLLQLR